MPPEGFATATLLRAPGTPGPRSGFAVLALAVFLELMDRPSPLTFVPAALFFHAGLLATRPRYRLKGRVVVLIVPGLRIVLVWFDTWHEFFSFRYIF